MQNADIDTPGPPKAPALSAGDLGAILWSGRFVLLVSLLIGIAWGFLIFPPGTMAARSRITIDLLAVPEFLATGAADPWSVLLQTAGLAETEETGGAGGVSIVRGPDRLTVTLTSTGDAADAHGQVIDKIERSLEPASSAFLDLFGATAGETARYVADARFQPGGVFGLKVETSQVAPRGVLALHLRFVLIALGAGTAATFFLHLLGVGRRRRYLADVGYNR